MSLNYVLNMGFAELIVTLLLVLIIDLLFFFWKKRIAEDILEEKGYPVGTKKVGWLMFFLPVVAWIYVAALPKKEM